jgi:hypothetical protein
VKHVQISTGDILGPAFAQSCARQDSIMQDRNPQSTQSNHSRTCGVVTDSRRHSFGPTPGASSLCVSHTDALLITPLRARMNSIGPSPLLLLLLLLGVGAGDRRRSAMPAARPSSITM